MATEHTVQQGENLVSIAKKYKIASWREIYQHPDNTAFRQLRPNPNILMPGDKIQIPEAKSKTVYVRTGANHQFVVKRNVQQLKFQLKDRDGHPKAGVKAVFNLNGKQQTVISKADGSLAVDIDQTDLSEIPLELYEDPSSQEPTSQFTVKPGHLDPPDTLSGLQARLNSLGYPCGTVDGIYGKKTRSGIESFQRIMGLAVTGQPDALVYSAAEKEYGC